MQRKFVNKHRQKRKYTRKIEEISSFSFSKTAYGMVPLMVLLVAFMSTIVISTPFRDALASIRFTFQPPQFSLSNPIAFIQSVALSFSQAGIFAWTVIIAIYEAFIQSFTAFFSGAGHTAVVVQNNIAVQKETTGSFITLVAKEATLVMNALLQILTFAGNFCFSIFYAVVTTITNAIIFIAQLIISFAIVASQIAAHVFTYLTHLVIVISLLVFAFIRIVAEIIWSMCVSVGTFIASTTQHILNTIVYLIELPFKIIYAFWLQIKPYVDVLIRHVQMTGSDFSNGVTSMGKVASLMGASK